MFTFVILLKLFGCANGKLDQFYNDLQCKFKDEAFIRFHDLLVGNHDGLHVSFVKSPIGDND
jgi:hypothetical protein